MCRFNLYRCRSLITSHKYYTNQTTSTQQEQSLPTAQHFCSACASDTNSVLLPDSPTVWWRAVNGGGCGLRLPQYPGRLGVTLSVRSRDEASPHFDGKIRNLHPQNIFYHGLHSGLAAARCPRSRYYCRCGWTSTSITRKKWSYDSFLLSLYIFSPSTCFGLPAWVCCACRVHYGHRIRA